MIANQDSLRSSSKSSAESAVKSASTIVDTTTVSSSRNARFGGLRKKRTLSDRNTVKLASYNSDFLLGIFADVAKAKVLKEFRIELPSSSKTSTAAETICPSSIFDGSSSPSHIVPDSLNSSPRPLKKSRVSFRASSYQSRASCLNLFAQSVSVSQSSSPSSGINEISSIVKDTKKQDSLAYQLDCLEKTQEEEQVKSTGALAISAIASISLTNKGKKVIKDVAALAFPNLPSTISDSSCESNNVTATGLTRKRCLVPHGSALEIAASPSGSKESFGWFVDLDDNEEPSAKDLVHSKITDKNASQQDLAFQAPTSPKQVATNHVQEEMEQAYAADTIDSVFGDFF